MQAGRAAGGWLSPAGQMPLQSRAELSQHLRCCPQRQRQQRMLAGVLLDDARSHAGIDDAAAWGLQQAWGGGRPGNTVTAQQRRRRSPPAAAVLPEVVRGGAMMLRRIATWPTVIQSKRRRQSPHPAASSSSSGREQALNRWGAPPW